ncbi:MULTISPECIES: HDOD domain-containing protein [unclassified Neptuniibacter]|uniref:HDOD domain-containing protein n=1 Tax=unclassified Neptuniibacter TaxID=2630693 RepID=UPI0026E27DA7|nr:MULTISPECIES: HDOD domain-containing protein [unclassified Neptuniibacter]MDO6514869.1 HDOD domain-containing protein [Neptuniibacter sp. 2_MG-2023]MDO6594554.1 HDOD domain-containing protein [Neptuniibacter sp. 1_MG-2023]
MSVGVCVLENRGELPQFRLVLLHDAEGKALAILPANSLLNLVAIWKKTGRQLQPVKGEDASRYFSQDALNFPDGQAKLLSLKLFIASECLQHEQLELIEPHSGLSFIAIAEQLEMGQRLELGLTLDQITEIQPEGNDTAVISKAVERFTVLRIQQRLEDTLGLPSLPPTVKKIIMLRSDPEAGVKELVPVVKLDPSLSAQVMSWAASPYYAAPGDVHSIDDAVIRVLGFDLVINMALGTAMGQMLKLPDDLPRGATPYWMQAVYNASLAEKLCRLMTANDSRPLPGLVYLSALLHNFGYLVLAHLFPPHFSLLSRYIEANPHFALDAIEQQILSVTREQIGSWLLASWDLPEPVTVAIRQQNNLEYKGEHEQYAKLLYLSNRLLRQQGLSDGPVSKIPDELYQELGLNEEEVAETLQELMSNENNIKELTEILGD